jgi:hypothetical protein
MAPAWAGIYPNTKEQPVRSGDRGDRWPWADCKSEETFKKYLFLKGIGDQYK